MAVICRATGNGRSHGDLKIQEPMNDELSDPNYCLAEVDVFLGILFVSLREEIGEEKTKRRKEDEREKKK